MDQEIIGRHQPRTSKQRQQEGPSSRGRHGEAIEPRGFRHENRLVRSG
ncbi:hypothetical protein LINPERPRIM_LOCUS4098 [Linum perenne]